MQIYSYHPETGEYLDTDTAMQSPLEPGVFLMPAHSTNLPPPLSVAGTTPVYVDGVWSLVDDFRGATYYDEAGTPIVIELLGAVPAGLTATPTAAALAAQFATHQVAALTAVDSYHNEMLQHLAGNPTQAEKDSWAMKVTTADAVKSGSMVSAAGQAFMSALGLSTPALQMAWANKVQANTAKFAALVGLADKLRSQAKAAILAATSQPELDAAQATNKTAAQAAIAALPKV